MPQERLEPFLRHGFINGQIVCQGVECIDLSGRESQLEPLNCEHDGLIKSLSFGRDGHLLSTASADRTARLCDVRMQAAEPRVFTNGLYVWDAKFSPDSSWFGIAGFDAVEIRDTTFERQAMTQGAGGRIVACADRGEARVWDAQTAITPRKQATKPSAIL